jgi:hypothetical protein
MTLESVAAAKPRLMVRCKACGRRAEPDPAEIAQRYGAETIVLEWRDRLVCSHCGSRKVDTVGRRWKDAMCGELTQGMLRSQYA